MKTVSASIDSIEECVICGRRASLSEACPGCGAPPCSNTQSDTRLGARLPGSSTGIHCHHHDQYRRGEGCSEKLELFRTTSVQRSHEDDYRELMPALDQAAVLLGWRVYQGVWWCPTHVAAKNLACARCLSACPSCACVGGPRSDAIEGIIVETTEAAR